LYFDTSSGDITGNSERFQRFLQPISMCDQRFQIDYTACYQSNGFWPGIVISILEFEIDFVDGEVHEW